MLFVLCVSPAERYCLYLNTPAAAVRLRKTPLFLNTAIKTGIKQHHTARGVKGSRGLYKARKHNKAAALKRKT